MCEVKKTSEEFVRLVSENVLYWKGQTDVSGRGVLFIVKKEIEGNVLKHVGGPKRVAYLILQKRPGCY